MIFKKLLLALLALLVLLALFLVFWGGETVKHLGCIWVIPSEMGKENKTYYPRLVTGESNLLHFLESTANLVDDTTSQYVALIEEHTNNGVLKVAVYESTEKAPLKGIKWYMITRDGYTGAVVSANSDYRNFLRECVD